MPNKANINIAIFASGGGTNAHNILTSFKDKPELAIKVLLTNNPHSGVFNFAPAFQVPVELLSKKAYQSSNFLKEILDSYDIDLIVLAGYLKMIPPALVEHYPRRIINIHPSLLPKYGGKGMYGQYVHQAVIAAQESHSGITIHFVDEIYDHGEHILQKKLKIQAEWDSKDLQRAIQQLEYKYFPEVIEKICRDIISA